MSDDVKVIAPSWKRKTATTNTGQVQTTAQRDLRVGDPVSFYDSDPTVYYVQDVLTRVGADGKFYVRLNAEANKRHVYNDCYDSAFAQSRLKLRPDVFSIPLETNVQAVSKRSDNSRAETMRRCGACAGVVDQENPHGAFTYPYSDDSSSVPGWLHGRLREVQFFCSFCAESIAKHIAHLKSGHAKPERPQRDRARTSSWCPEDPDDLL